MAAGGTKITDNPRRRLYGRRHGPKLSARKISLIKNHLPGLLVDIPDDAGCLVPTRLFARPVREVWLEIGFGAGEHLTTLARAFPDVGFIGCEPYVSGMARLLGLMDEQGLDNIRLYDSHGQDMMEALQTACLGRIFLLFPDPWPKRRHWRRRFVNPAVVREAARILTDGGRLHIASDAPGYVRWTLRHMTAPHPAPGAAFEWRAESPADWRQRSPDWPVVNAGPDYPETRYETKARAAGRQPVYLTFRRFPRNRPVFSGEG